MSSGFKRSALVLVFALLFSCGVVPKGNNVPRHADIDKAVAKLTESGIPLQKDPRGNVRWIEAKNGEF